MFGSTVLEVALGIIFVYLLLSLMCSALAELLEAFLKKRASDLERGLRELLADSQGTGMVQQIYQHPLLSGFFQGDYKPGFTKNLPSYIPSHTFALTLLDIALPNQAMTAPPVAGAAGAAAAAAAPAPAAFALRDAAMRIPDARLQRILVPLVESAGNDYNKVLTAIEDWYNASMERVGGWYKRRTQNIVLMIGLLLSVAINADTLTIVRVLSRDPASRARLVQAAEDYSKSQTPEVDAKTRFENSISSVERLGLPVGWDRTNVQLVPPMQEPASWFLKIVGWLLTAIAVSLGAPFWFDLLNKFISIRATVKPKSAA